MVHREHAVGDLSQAVRLDPTASLFHFTLGLAFAAKGEPDLALIAYDAYNASGADE